MKWLRVILLAAISLSFFYLLNYQHGMLPALGKFANPFAGFWRNGANLDRLPTELHLPGLQDSVVITWDERKVAHIFAGNDHDLYFTQGYLTASHRLWQMEFQILAACGRLSEIIGPQTLEYDRYRRRLGLLHAAEQTRDAMLADSQVALVVQAYADGVNAFIDRLDAAHLPLEYKLLDYQPQPWSALNSAILLKQMAWDLTGYQINEMRFTGLHDLLGEELFSELYPLIPPFTDPIIPPEVEFDFTPLPNRREVEDVEGISLSRGSRLDQTPLCRGSNNWAVSGMKTVSGAPILCNDPHLGLHLPSVWYEIQLVSPTLNVYGVTLPGAPAVVIGFNRDVAWGLTNAETDVLDWYSIEYQDKTKTSYRYGEEWRQVQLRLEEIKIRGTDSVVDTIRYTHYGPVPYEKGAEPYDPDIPIGMAMRWSGHAASGELLTLLGLNRARNHADYLKALTYYDCPAQNFVFASRDGDIAIQHNGKFPLRKPGLGQFLLDGADPDNEWEGWIPREHLPQVKNPARGFVSSANQAPVGKDYPYYLNGNYAPYYRSSRINQSLSSQSEITPEDMMKLQNDVVALNCKRLLPVLLPLLDTLGLDTLHSYCLSQLSSWDYRYLAESSAPIIFEYWWRELRQLIWEDDFGELGFGYPRDDVTEAVIATEPESEYIDIQSTEEVERLADLAERAFAGAVSALVDEFGAPDDSWSWGKVRPLTINHLARIPGLGSGSLRANGWWNTVCARAGSYGASWRMIIPLGDQATAWGVYPGGQSGNPGSLFYDHGITRWLDGDYYSLHYLSSVDDPAASNFERTILRNRE